MRSWLVSSGIPIVIAVVFALGITFVTNTRQTQTAIEVRAPELLPTPAAMIYVHVAGAVAVPGVYALTAGSHVFDAIAAAGGANDDADEHGALNLASKVTDGQKLVVPTRRAPGDTVPPPAAVQSASGEAAQPSASGATINVNTASQKMLESLPGIGPVTATKVIARRDSTGPFTRIEQLKDEKIVNASTFERIKARISVD